MREGRSEGLQERRVVLSALRQVRDEDAEEEQDGKQYYREQEQHGYLGIEVPQLAGLGQVLDELGCGASVGKLGGDGVGEGPETLARLGRRPLLQPFGVDPNYPLRPHYGAGVGLGERLHQGFRLDDDGDRRKGFVGKKEEGCILPLRVEAQQRASGTPVRGVLIVLFVEADDSHRDDFALAQLRGEVELFPDLGLRSGGNALMRYGVDNGATRALRDPGSRRSALIEHDVVLDVRERHEEAETGDDALPRADGKVFGGSIDQHRHALDVGLLSEEGGLRDQVLQGEAHRRLVGEQCQGGLARFLHGQERRGTLDDGRIEGLSVCSPYPAFRIQRVEDADDYGRHARRPGGYGSRSRVQELGKLGIVLSLVGRGRYGPLADQARGKNDLMVYFELEVLGHFGRDDRLDHCAERGTVDGAGCHSPFDELDVLRQVREVLEVSARNVDSVPTALGEGDIRRSDDGDSALDEPLMAVVHVQDMLFDGLGDNPFGVLNRLLRRYDFGSKDIDLRLVDAVEGGIERKLVEGLEVDRSPRADGRGNQDADEHRQQEFPVVGDAPGDDPCEREFVHVTRTRKFVCTGPK